MAEAIRVLIADDQAPLRAAFRMLVTSDPGMVVVAEAANGEQALTLAAKHQPDVVLMDVEMPGMGGVEATRRLCSQPQGPRVVILTMFDLDEYVSEALRAGASGFLLKNAAPAEVIRAVRVVYEGNALLAPEITKRLITQLAAPAQTPKRPDLAEDSRLARLTARERETFELIVRGWSNAEISAELHLTRTTVRTYVSRILTKLEARDRAGLIVIGYESGVASR